jgi:hypothetical protein
MNLSPRSRTRALAAAMAVLLAGAALTAEGARATTVLQVDVPAMVRLSESVVRARIVATRDVDLRPEVRSGLFTDVELEVLEVVRGRTLPKRHVMRLHGGAGGDGIALTVPGMPRFKVGEEVVLFLEKSAHGHLPCGLEQGVWRVARGSGGAATASQDTAGVQLMRRDTAGRLVPVKGHPSQVMPLEALLRAIRGV